MEMVQRKSPEVKARPAENGFGLELVLSLLVVLAVILADAFLFVFYPIEGSEVIEMVYSEGLTIAFTKGILLFSLVGGALSWLLSLLLLLLLRQRRYSLLHSFPIRNPCPCRLARPPYGIWRPRPSVDLPFRFSLLRLFHSSL